MKFAEKWAKWEQAIILEYFKRIRTELCAQCRIKPLCNRIIRGSCYRNFLHMAEEEFIYNVRER
jgi:hypothetical protein